MYNYSGHTYMHLYTNQLINKLHLYYLLILIDILKLMYKNLSAFIIPILQTYPLQYFHLHSPPPPLHSP